MSGAGTWKPLLEGELANEARQAVDAVAAELATAHGALEENEAPAASNATLAGGNSGLALFYAYLALDRQDDAAADLAVTHLDRAIEALATQPLSPGLYSGFTGVGWTVEHLTGRLIESEDEGSPDIEEALLTLLDSDAWNGEYDLISGFAGFGVFALEALRRPTARTLLARLVASLDALSQDGSPGTTWRTPVERVPVHQREVAPDGYFNLGVAHGVPAVVALLAASLANGEATDRTRELLEGGMEWMLAQELPADSASRFPNFVGEGVTIHPSRLAWCYGDAGIAAVLLGAARATGRADWEAAARRISLAAAARSIESAGALDSGLCHGAAGLGHIFNRLYQATGDETLGDAARAWMSRALELRRPGQGIAGFQSYTPTFGGWHTDHGFLTGAAGVALALHAATSAIEPEWDRVLMTAIPPRG